MCHESYLDSANKWSIFLTVLPSFFNVHQCQRQRHLLHNFLFLYPSVQISHDHYWHVALFLSEVSTSLHHPQAVTLPFSPNQLFGSQFKTWKTLQKATFLFLHLNLDKHYRFRLTPRPACFLAHPWWPISIVCAWPVETSVCPLCLLVARVTRVMMEVVDEILGQTDLE